MMSCRVVEPVRSNYIFSFPIGTLALFSPTRRFTEVAPIVIEVVHECLVILFGAHSRIRLLHPLALDDILANEMGIEGMYGLRASVCSLYFCPQPPQCRKQGS